jgi:hypothetical protein
MEKMPARHDYLEIEKLDKELLVYNPVSNEAHALNPTTALILEKCDGQTLRSEVILALEAGEPGPEVLEFGLAELAAAGLLKDVEKAPNTISRREFATRWGGLAVAIPLVLSITAPRPADAQSIGTTTTGIMTTTTTTTTTTGTFIGTFTGTGA